MLLIEENRSHLKITTQNSTSSDYYVQQLNHKELETIEYDAANFFNEESAFNQVYVLTQLRDTQAVSVLKPSESHFFTKGGSKQTAQGHLKDYIVRAEKILYYTLEKVQFRGKLNA